MSREKGMIKNKELLALEEAVDGAFVVRGRVDRWLGDRGYGFVKVKGKSVFCRTERVVGKKSMEMGELAWVKVVRDWSREDESWKAEEAWTDEGWEIEVKRRRGGRLWSWREGRRRL